MHGPRRKSCTVLQFNAQIELIIFLWLIDNSVHAKHLERPKYRIFDTSYYQIFLPSVTSSVNTCYTSRGLWSIMRLPKRVYPLPNWGLKKKSYPEQLIQPQLVIQFKAKKEATTTLKEKSRGKWTKDIMHKALGDITQGRRKIREASRYYCIPEASIRAWKYGKFSSKKMGPPIVLTAKEETALVKWCEERQLRVAHCVSLSLFRGKVKQICDGKETPFTNGLPGKHWWKYFSRRHPELVLRRSESLDLQRAKGASPRKPVMPSISL